MRRACACKGSKEFIRAATDAAVMAETPAGPRRLSYAHALQKPERWHERRQSGTHRILL